MKPNMRSGQQGKKKKKRTCINIGKPPAPSTIVYSILLIDKNNHWNIDVKVVKLLEYYQIITG